MERFKARRFLSEGLDGVWLIAENRNWDFNQAEKRPEILTDRALRCPYGMKASFRVVLCRSRNLVSPICLDPIAPGSY